MSSKVQTVAPGYILLNQHEIKSKVGNWQVAGSEGEDAPEVGVVLEVGPELPEKKMPFAGQYLPKVGDIVAYKRYTHFKFGLGAKEIFAVAFENYLFTLEKEKSNEQA